MDATCNICPFNCKIPDKGIGKCHARGNVNGKIISLSYGRVTTMIDGPVEQKLYHFHPGMRILSVGSTGCNLICKFCQNHEISQGHPGNISYDLIAPDDIVAQALKRKLPAIAFTYNEPMVNYECVLETAKLARRHGLMTILKTNGYFEKEAFSDMVAWMDAVNIDVKGTVALYREVCGIALPDEPCEWLILENLKEAVSARCHVEVSTLAVHGYCDDAKNEMLFASIHAMGGREIPLRILKMIPDHRMRDLPPVEDWRLLAMKESAMKYFSHVYVDNAGMPNVTECSQCGKTLVTRNGMEIVENNLVKGKCPGCGYGNGFKTGK